MRIITRVKWAIGSLWERAWLGLLRVNPQYESEKKRIWRSGYNHGKSHSSKRRWMLEDNEEA